MMLQSVTYLMLLQCFLTLSRASNIGSVHLEVVVLNETTVTFSWEFEPMNSDNDDEDDDDDDDDVDDQLLPLHYILRYKKRGTNTGDDIRLDGNITSYTRADLEPGQEYGARIFALVPEKNKARPTKVLSKWANVKMPEGESIDIVGTLRVVTGNQLMLVCAASGTTTLPLTVDWFKDGAKLSGSRFRQQDENQLYSVTSTLLIQSTNMLDTGTYTCRTSDYQITSVHVTIVTDEPDTILPTTPDPFTPLVPPVGVKVSSSSDLSVINVTWVDIGYDTETESDILYTIRYGTEGEADFVLRYTSDHFLLVPMSSLQHNSVYDFSVRTTRGTIHSTYSIGYRFTVPDTADVPVMFESTRLPKALKPTDYEIELRLHTDGPPENFSFSGTVRITMDCLIDTTVIWIHSLHLDIATVSMETTEPGRIQPTSDLEFNEDSNKEMLKIRSPVTLRSGRRYTMILRYSGKISSALKGFYYSPYTDGNSTKYIFTTMMEPTDARRVFPCFDEPEMKAVFQISLICNKRFTALSNMPLNTSMELEGGLRQDTFERTVLMSTYLVAFAVGELSHLETNVNGYKLKTWSRSNAVDQTLFSMNIGAEVMKFFESYFQIPYSLPKVDMVAMPTLIFNAMEHWGMISYRESSMLFEDGVSSEKDREWTSILVAHELSHQWFGNLVSPKWWDDLWLNEGFATYMMFLAIDSVRPEWKMMNKLAVNYRGIQNVFQADDVITSHPVYVPVNDAQEINEIFDLISYAKGCSIIRMMNFFLGDHTFQNGLTRYLRKHEFSSATHGDLWEALRDQAIEDENEVTDVKLVMDTWLLEKNYPVVMVTRPSNSTVHMSQSAFLISAEDRQKRSNIFWEIPFVYTTDIVLNFENKKQRDIVWLHKDGLNVTHTDSDLARANWVLGNPTQTGFYRVNYEESNWQALVTQLKTDHQVIHPINRAQIINDAWNLARAGLLSLDIALSTLEYLGEEQEYTPWVAALNALNFLDSSLALTPAYGDFKLFMQSKLTKAYGQPAQSHYGKVLQNLITGAACKYQLPACQRDALSEFMLWKQKPTYRVNPNIKQSVYCTGVKLGTRADWTIVLQRYVMSTSASEKKFLLESLLCTTEPWIVASFLQMTLVQEELSNIEAVDAIHVLGSTVLGRLMLWDFLVENWDFFFTSYGSGLNLFSKLINSVTVSYNTQTELNRVKEFVKIHDDLGTATRTFDNAISNTEIKVEWMSTNYATVRTWLESALARD